MILYTVLCKQYTELKILAVLFVDAHIRVCRLSRCIFEQNVSDNQDFSAKLSDNFYCVPQGSRNHPCSYNCNVRINHERTKVLL